MEFTAGNWITLAFAAFTGYGAFLLVQFKQKTISDDIDEIKEWKKELDKKDFLTKKDLDAFEKRFDDKQEERMEHFSKEVMSSLRELISNFKIEQLEKQAKGS